MTVYPYTYSLLRYVHDPVAGESVNVGVVLVSEEARFIGVKCRRNTGRLTKIFPDMDRAAYGSIVRHAEAKAAKLGKQAENQMIFDTIGSSDSVAISLLPHDDSAFQWSEIRSGISKKPQKTLELLFERMVAKYDEPAALRKKNDSDVWRTFRTELEERQVLKHFHKTVIRSSDDTLEVDHAFKNGVWHCLEPLSFDLSDEDYIKDKAYKWAGHLTSVQDQRSDFKIYFLVGEPQDTKLAKAFNTAVNILRKPEVDIEIFRESEVEDLSDLLEDQIRASIAD